MLTVVHTHQVAASGDVHTSVKYVRSLSRKDLLKCIGATDYKMTEYEYHNLSAVRMAVAVLRTPQEKPWTYDTHTFTHRF